MLRPERQTAGDGTATYQGEEPCNPRPPGRVAANDRNVSMESNRGLEREEFVGWHMAGEQPCRPPVQSYRGLGAQGGWGCRGNKEQIKKQRAGRQVPAGRRTAKRGGEQAHTGATTVRTCQLSPEFEYDKLRWRHTHTE